VQFSDNQKALLQYLSDGNFHSGTELAVNLSMTRSAVWKLIHALNALGVEIIALNAKGYRLNAPLELLNLQVIKQALSTDALALLDRLELHDQMDSTNRYLSELAHTHPEESGVICVAEQQTAGRGRRGRPWVSPFARNIYMSLLWRFEEGPAGLSGLSLAIGVAVVRALKQQGVEEVGLKWPNDIYWQNKKLGGILLEVSGESAGPCSAVIGVGLNVNMSQDEAEAIDQEWIDVQGIIGKERVFSRGQLLASMITTLLEVTANYTQDCFSAYVDEWRKYDCMQGRKVDVFIGNKTVTGHIRGIDDDGLLLLEIETGEIKHYASGEISFHRP